MSTSEVVQASKKDSDAMNISTVNKKLHEHNNFFVRLCVPQVNIFFKNNLRKS